MRLGICKPSQYHLDALKKKWCRKAIECDSLCAMEKSKDDGAHITGVSLSKNPVKGSKIMKLILLTSQSNA